MKLNWASSSKRYSDEKPSTYVWHNQVLSWRLPKIKNKQISGRAADEILCREGIMSLHVIECMERRNNRMEKKIDHRVRHFIETTECLRYWSVKLNSRIYANSPSTQERWSYFQDHGTEWCYGKTVRNFRPTHDDRQSSPLETIPFLKERKEEKSKEPYW